MKLRVILTLIFLTIFLSTAGLTNANSPSTTQWQSDPEIPDCLGQNLLGQYDYDLLNDHSYVTKDGNAVVSVLCNYSMSTRPSHPSGPGNLSGMAITINFACPEQTTSDWKGKTENRDDAISRTSNSVLLRETGNFTSFSGEHTIQEKMFLLLDTHTNATIVVNTDPLPGTTDQPIYSATTAQAIAAGLAVTYAPRANDPQCGLPPTASGSGSTSPGGTPIAGFFSENESIHHLPGATAIAVAVGAGAIVVIAAGGLLTGAGGFGLGSTSTSSATASAAATSTRPAQPLPTPASPAPVSPASSASYTPTGGSTTPDIQGAGVAPPLQPTAPIDNTAAYSPYAPTQPQPATSVEPAISPVDSPPQTIQPTPPTSPVSPPPAEPINPASVPSIVQPVIQAAETVLAVGGAVAQASSMSKTGSTSESDQGQDDSEETELEKRCPEAEAYLFGLPAINSRADCPGLRPGMGPWYAGLDFTSKNEHGETTSLDFDACVSGVVTYTGGPFNMIEIKRENGNRIQFLHASEIYVAVGTEVEANTKLGKTGGTGPEGPNQYETHLHVQSIDEHGNMIDPDCAISGGENRELKIKGSESPHRKRIESEATSHKPFETVLLADDTIHTDPNMTLPSVPAVEAVPAVEPVPAIEAIPAIVPDLPAEPEPLIIPAPEQETAPPIQLVQPTPAIEPVPIIEPIAPIAPVPTGDEPKFCSNCGQSNPGKARFCKNCGHPFAQV